MRTKEVLLSIIKTKKWTSLHVKDYIEAKDEPEFPLSNREYARQGGCMCPFCGGGDVTPGGLSFESHAIYQEIYCNVCEKDWADSYKLMGYVE